MYTIDKITKTDVNKKTPFSVDMCENATDVRENGNSILHLFDVEWTPADNTGYGTCDGGVNESELHISYVGLDMKCRRFTVNEGLPGRLASVEAGRLWFSLNTPSQDLPTSRKVYYAGKLWVVRHSGPRK